MDLLLLEDSMIAFVAISTDSFYLTCFQNPCWIFFFFSVLKNCISLLKFKFGFGKMSKIILQMACSDMEVPEIGHSVREVTCLFPGG